MRPSLFTSSNDKVVELPGLTSSVAVVVELLTTGSEGMMRGGGMTTVAGMRGASVGSLAGGLEGTGWGARTTFGGGGTSGCGAGLKDVSKAFFS